MPDGLNRSPKIDKAMELLRDGTARSFQDAANRVGASVQGVNQRWRKEEGDREIPWRVKQAEEAEAADLSENPREPSSEELALARRLTEAKTGRSAAVAEARELRRQTVELEEEVAKLRETLQIARSVETIADPEWTTFAPDDGKHRGTLIACYSDFHIGEVVEPSEMAWYNAYNPEIAELRVARFFQRTIRVARKYLQGIEYEGIVVPNLGDTISGEIHDEFRETNEWSNYEAIPYAVRWTSAGIGMLADEFGKVHVVCSPGNHPRDSRKPRYKRRSAHNADTLISQLVASEFANDDRVTFDIPDGISADFQVYETRFRQEHGDEATGGSGIQGAMLPIALRTHRVRKQAQAEGRPFDVLLMGHWHQLMSMPAKGFVVNGAGKGYDEFARGKGYEPEPPQQALMLVTPEHGISGQWPLYVGDREREGW